MRSLNAALLLIATTGAKALALGPDEFVAAKRLNCVLAQDSLGYFDGLISGIPGQDACRHTVPAAQLC